MWFYRQKAKDESATALHWHFGEAREGKRSNFVPPQNFSLSQRRSPGPRWPQAHCHRPCQSVLGQTGSYETAEQIQMHNFSGKTCLSCKEPSLLSSLFLFPVWVKHRASPNLVLSWESIQENKQEEDWLDVSFSREQAQPGSFQAVQLAFTNGQFINLPALK